MPPPAQPPRADYVERINRAIDLIQDHLGEPLRLDDVARAARVSPFHFHRIFKGVMGETVNAFIKRTRLERAVSLMRRGEGLTLTEVALRCGFSSSSDFSRSFRQHFDMPPSRFDVEGLREERRGELLDLMEKSGLRPRIDRLPPGENPDGFEVELVELPARTVAYRRVHDPYRGTGVVDAARELMAWADGRGLGEGRWYGYMWEDPDVARLEDCRYDVAVELPPEVAATFRADGPVGRHDFPPMRVAELSLAGDIELELRALDWIFGTWLPGSGRLPADQPCFEAWVGRPFAHGMEHFELALQLPLR